MDDQEKREIRDFYLKEIQDSEIKLVLQALDKTCQVAATIGVEMTREDILPALENVSKETTDDEVMLALANQLKCLTPFVGGPEHALSLLKILWHMSSTDEKLVREAIVTSLKCITQGYSKQMFKDEVLPAITQLADKEWSFSKCTALMIISMSYSNFDEESKRLLRKLVRDGFLDDAPMVRKASSECLEDLIHQVDKEHLMTEFLPVLDLVTSDPIDSVRTSAVPLTIAMGKVMDEQEFKEHIEKIIDKLKDDSSWRVQMVLASKISDLLRISEGEEYLKYVQNIFAALLAHKELEVQALATENLLSFYEAAKENCEKDNRDFDKFFMDYHCALIHEIIYGCSDDVRTALSRNIVQFSRVLSVETFKNEVLKNLVAWMQTEEVMTVQENILLNLNQIPKNIDISLLIESISQVVRSLLTKSGLHWRSRRNLLLAFIYLAKFMSKESFNDHFKMFYSRLIGDQIFAVRRTVPIILPILAKQYGIKWLSSTIVPHFMILTKDSRYLYSYMPLYCINELLFPTLEKEPNKPDKYLGEYKSLQDNPEVPRSLYKVSKLFNKIKVSLEEEAIQLILVSDVPKYTHNSDIQLYAEETLTILKDNYTDNFYTISDRLDCTYIEGILTLISRDFLNSVIVLSGSSAENIRIYSKYTLNNIKKFLEKLNIEFNQPWVKETLSKVSGEDADALNKEIEESLAKKTIIEDDEIDVMENIITTDTLPDLGVIPDLEVNEADESDIGMTEFMSEEIESAASKEDKVTDEDDVLSEINSIIAKENETETKTKDEEEKNLPVEENETKETQNDTKEKVTEGVCSSSDGDTLENVDIKLNDNDQKSNVNSSEDKSTEEISVSCK